MGKRWLVAVDSSKNGEKAFQVVCGMMNKKEDELFVLSVAEPLTTVAAGPYVDYSYISDANRHIEDHIREVLKKYGERCAEAKIKYTCLMGRGQAKESIIKEVNENKIDILVTGRRGLNPVARAFLGSTSSFLSHNIPCSYMVVHMGEEEEQ